MRSNRPQRVDRKTDACQGGPAWGKLQDIPLILDTLAKELSTAALSEADIESLEARTFEEESKVERPRERAKPRVFISPSLEGLEYARALEGYLEQFAIPQIWNEQQF